MTEAIIILMNMRGGCATVGEKVHTLFKVTNRIKRSSAGADSDNIANATQSVTVSK